MSGVEYILALLILLGPLIFVHELGHFLAAKLFGVRVEVFSIGFGPRLFGVRWGETDYRVAPIPLGGYVRMAGEYVTGEASDDPGLLTAKPRWQRLVILIAGPAVNVLFAGCIWWSLFMHGFPIQDIPDGPPVVEIVLPDSPALAAGLLPGDRILAVGGTRLATIGDFNEEVAFRAEQETVYEIERDGTIRELTVNIGRDPELQVGWDGVYPRAPIAFGRVFEDSPAEAAGLETGDRLLSTDGRAPEGRPEFVAYIEQRAGTPISLGVRRDGEIVSLVVTPAPNEEGKGKIGVEIGVPTRYASFGPAEAAVQALDQIWRQSGLLYRSLKAVATGVFGLGALSGPLEIGRIAREQIELGWLPFFALMAGLSLQLGLLNLLPIPVLDGGQILIIGVEGVRGRDLSPPLREKVLITGLVMVVLLMVTIIGLDVAKLRRSVARDAAATPPQVEAPGEPAAPGESPPIDESPVPGR